MPTLNSEKTLDESLRSIVDQDYPRDKIEILIVDGGSDDQTLQIAEKSGCKIIKAGYKNNQEIRRGIGLSRATGEIIAVIDSDNILPYSQWLRDMIDPLISNKDVVASQTLHYFYNKNDLLFNRYTALFGVNDPVVLFLKKADRMMIFQEHWDQSKVLFENDKYILTEFNKDNLPTVGCNGFLIKKQKLLESNWRNGNYFHIDVIYDLTLINPIKVAIVKNSIWHKTGNTFFDFIKKRFKYFRQYSNSPTAKRRYYILDFKKKKDLLRLLGFSIAGITFIYPFIQSMVGFRKQKDIAWFVHPFLCIIFLMMYTYSSILIFLHKQIYEK